MLPPKDRRQTALFSATFPADIQQLARSSLRNGFEIVDTVGETEDETAEKARHNCLLAYPNFIFSGGHLSIASCRDQNICDELCDLNLPESHLTFSVMLDFDVCLVRSHALAQFLRSIAFLQNSFDSKFKIVFELNSSSKLVLSEAKYLNDFADTAICHGLLNARSHSQHVVNPAAASEVNPRIQGIVHPD